MKNILLPTDFSENAWNAIKYAIALFEHENCVFHLLNTYTPAIPNSRIMAAAIGGSLLEDRIKSSSENGLQELLERIAKNHLFTNHTFKTISSFNLLVDEIKEVVEREQIDFIIMGTKGASGLEAVFMGSNTVSIIKSIKNCPVIAIPYNFEFKKPNEIAFATDFTRFYTESELRPLLDLAIAFEAVIRIVHVQFEIKSLTELQHFNLNMLRKYLKPVEHYVHTVSELKSVSKSLEIFANELDIHLVAMLNFQHSLMEKMTREPVIKIIAFHTQVPLLVIPELGMGGHAIGKKGKEASMSD